MLRRVSVIGLVAVIAGLIGFGGTAPAATSAAQWHANPRGNLDCNGWSPVQKLFRQLHCVEITGNEPNGLFEDNGHYVGHDEPANEFFSTKKGSGYSQSYDVTLPTDPKQ